VNGLLADGRARAGVIMLGVLAIFAVLAPAIAPTDPIAQGDVVATRFLAPLAVDAAGVRHWLGTDALGRDLLGRLVYGARISLAVGLLAVTLSVAIGTAVGVIAAMAGGWIERALMALTDAVLALPRLVLLLALVTLWEPSFVIVVGVIGGTGWMAVARLARIASRRVLAEPYVDAARAAGVRSWRLVARHVLPNAVTPIAVAAALGVGNAIMLEAGLAFLGLGVPAPAPSWGNMIASGRDALVHAPWVATFPGLAVVAAVLGSNLLGDGLQQALDPRAGAPKAT
jgi:peptide/nickel transport system permease protein